MKRIGLVAVLLIVALMFASCKGNADPTPDTTGESGGTVVTYKAGDTALEKIKIGTKEYDTTAEVYVTGPNGATITGEDPEFDKSKDPVIYAGVFRTGRNVTLSPYIMSKYEVTQQLYAAVMKKNSNGVHDTPSNFRSSPATSEDLARPVECVTWYDAVYFCNLLTEKTMTAEDKVYTITDIIVESFHISSATVTMDMNIHLPRIFI